MNGRWSSVGLALFPLEEGRELAHSGVTGASMAIPTAEADLLLACASFRRLEEHAATPEALPVLERAAAAGLLVSEAAVLDIARSRPRPAPPAPSALGIVTRNRPEDLSRCLASFKAPEVVICDDGSLPAVPPGARYAGAPEKARYLDALSAESGLPRDLAAFALGDVGFDGFRAGGNRNALYLDLIDRLYVSVDDDVVGRCAAAPEPRAGIQVGVEGAPFESWSYPDRESVLQAAPAVEVDFLAAHGTLLGRDPSTLAGLEAGTVGPSLVRRLRRDGGFVAVTMTGIAGDCAAGSASWMFLLDPRSRERLAGTDGAWELSKRSREVLRISARPLLSDQPSLMTYACGYDARALLPPFPPFGRNEDGGFSFALMCCVPGALIGHLPLALLHAPGGTRGYELSAGGRPGISDLLVTCMASLEPSPGLVSAEDSHRLLGRHLQDLAGLPDVDYDEALRRLFWHRSSGRLERLERERKESAGCPARALDLARAIEKLQASLLKPESAVPSDVPGADLAAQRALAKAYLGRYGALLEAWPDLVDAARRLSARGRRLSR